ncbi:MAG: DUF3783 domain-containing protein [Lachnospiraceae bacterium]|nr:DUF3783 domain-containing protein [Lachnospiraceae bacterium]
MKQAVIFQPDDGVYMLLSGLMKRLGICEKRISGKELTKTVAELFGLPLVFPAKQEEEYNPLQPVPAMIILAGFSQEELDEFLDARKEAGLRGAGLLAMMTPDNLGWTAFGLARELQREHEEMRKRLEKKS